ncbi:FAD/NAD(P)-binding domain-containing protein [Zopfia rhizophila CBS 207.26]|uniref:FAD/NAD(P)-binding domain-containing protein n=1 Tax=Zopfia rhizophila CBS 207.26 TaxID=1314779 RepID=A0A6A6EC78_9PEZI|nr:FAD/NAD(P)-binding domain-containing protein [Zopfia rhizophila CBS 207.26]
MESTNLESFVASTVVQNCDTDWTFGLSFRAESGSTNRDLPTSVAVPPSSQTPEKTNISVEKYHDLFVPDLSQCSPQPIIIIHIGMGASGLLAAHKPGKFLFNYELVCYEKIEVIGGTRGYYSYAPETQDYLMRFCKKHNLELFVDLNTKVIGTTWNELKGKWHVELERKGGSEFIDKYHALINDSGPHDFRGVLAHSADWPQDLDWAGKRVAAIGTGSNFIQMVSRLAETASHLAIFMQNCTYIAPQFSSSISNTETDLEAMGPQAAGKHQYTKKEKLRFRDDPDYHLKYCTEVEKSLSAAVNSIPSWSLGCHRLTGRAIPQSPDPPLETCVMNNDITYVTPSGLVTADGTLHEVDILACATGFHVQYLPHFLIRGVLGQLMQDQIEQNIYFSIAGPSFPNYFAINGPRGNWGQGCALRSHERKQHIKDQLNIYIDVWHQKHSIWQEECKSASKANSKDGGVYIWPGSLLHYLKCLNRPRYEHFRIEYEDMDNVKHGKDAPVPYIRNCEDESWDVE